MGGGEKEKRKPKKPTVGTGNLKPGTGNPHKTMFTELFAMFMFAAEGVAGSFTLAIAGAGAALGVGMIGAKAAEAVGRNPGAFGKILVIGIIGMALAEAIAIYALILAFAQGR